MQVMAVLAQKLRSLSYRLRLERRMQLPTCVQNTHVLNVAGYDAGSATSCFARLDAAVCRLVA